LKLNIYNLSTDELSDLISSLNEPLFRVAQIQQGLYQHLLTDWSDFTSLPKDLRKILQDQFSIVTIAPVEKSYSSDQLSSKTLFRLSDSTHIETVLLHKGPRATLCVSTQVGCPVGCVFCASGKLGFKRNLTVGEIIEQVLFYSRELHQQGKTLTNIVLMGMGEPLLNYVNTVDAIRKMVDPELLNIGARRITLSTIGIIPELNRLALERMQINLAISLHAPTQNLRNKLVPISRQHTLNNLLTACRNYFNLTGRRITFEYVMISGLNDLAHQAIDLVNLLTNLNCHVNLIPLNPIPQFEGLATPSKTMLDFGRILLDHGIPVSIRSSQGTDIQAGCGQLAGKRSR